MPPALQKRIAGLPAWAWLAVIGGGLTIGLILRSRQTDETAETELPDDETYVDAYDETAYSPEDAGYYTMDPGFSLGGTGGYSYGGYNFDQDAFMRELKDTIGDTFEDYFPDGVGGGTATTTSVGCTKANRPRNIPKGYTVECRNDRWHLVAKPGKGGGGDGKDDGKGDGGKGGKGDGGKGHGGKGDGGKGHGGKGGKNQKASSQPRAVERVVTGGGPPRRRGVHTPNNQGMAAKTGSGGRGNGSTPKRQVRR